MDMVDKTTEFLHETRHNAIYSDGNSFYLLHRKSGRRWKFDKDRRVLAGLIDFIDSSGSVTTDGRNWQSDSHVAQIMWELYHPYENRHDRRVLYADEDKTNLTSANLYLRGQSMSVIQNRRIWHNEKRIFLRCLCNEALFFTDYEADLFDLLCCTNFLGWYVTKSTHGNGFRLITMYGKLRVNLAEIVYAYYNYGLRVSNMSSVLPMVKRELSPKGFEIDHLRNNPQNNTLHNLSLMPKSLNSRKKDLAVRINAPFWFIPVQKSGKIRISLGDASTPGSEKFVICDSAKKFVDFLAEYQRQCYLSKRMVNHPVRTGYTRCAAQMLVDDGLLDQSGNYNIIETLLGMDESQFESVA